MVAAMGVWKQQAALLQLQTLVVAVVATAIAEQLAATVVQA